jgi:dTDP-4-amino-4,6-dideoxygalactose transaminase
MTIDPDKVRRAVGPKTKAVIVVHLYGQSADLDGLLAVCHERELVLIEDCAQSTGGRYKGRRLGSVGRIAAFSFYPTKNLGALGDGGCVVTDDKDLAERCRQLREYGWTKKFISEIRGINSRLDEVQAAILRIKLKYLESDNERRRQIARSYSEAFSTLPIKSPKVIGTESVFHLYVIQSDHRDSLKEHLRTLGIMSGIHYPIPIHLQPAYRDRIRQPGSLTHTETSSRQILSLPMYPELTQSELAQVLDGVLSWSAKEAATKPVRRAA